MTDTELLTLLDRLRSVLISVSTGGPRIGEVNHQYQQDYRDAADALTERGIENPLQYDDLWQWYGKWSADLPSYASRRVFIAELFVPLIASVRAVRVSVPEPTGWERVDRVMADARERLPARRTKSIISR